MKRRTKPCAAEDAPNSDLAGWDGGVTYVDTGNAVVKTLHVNAPCGPNT